MRLSNINLSDKQKLFEMAMALSLPEQEVIVSALNDEVLAKEVQFRMEERNKKLQVLQKMVVQVDDVLEVEYYEGVPYV